MSLSLYALAALVACAAAGPISHFEPTTHCALSCPDVADPAYAPGQSFQYAYESTVTTAIPGATEEASRLYMTATVTVEVLDKCELALTLSSVSLEDADPTSPTTRTPVPHMEEFRAALQQNPLRFAMHAGRVEGLCPSESEETWVLNVKRAILSGFQMTAPKDLSETITVPETDVVGECEAVYSPLTSSWSTTTLRKTKDLLACTGRQDTDSIIQSISYTAQSRLQSLPLLKSTHECDQEINSGGRLISATCQENHVFRPFSREESGAKTSVTFTLTFTRQSSAVSTSIASVQRRESILFEHVSKPEEQSTARRATMTTMRNMCATTEEGVTTETPAEFLALVKEMKKLDTATLMEVASNANNERPCARASKFFNDALPTVATEAAISVMRSMIVDGTVTGTEADLWMTSMTFINTPTRQMLADAKPLLEMSEPMDQAVLAVSSMVHSYCKTDSNCATKTEVTAIISLLKNMLGGDCSAEHSRVLLALKALGNTGRVETAVTILTQCFQNADLPMNLRVEAVNAFRRSSCAADTEPLRRLMEDTTSDSELRINAYLMVMQCPDYSLIQAITSLLEHEQVNQVGSFIWTHLTNLAETSCPFKQEIRRILSNVDLQTTFDLDKRKFSRNMEWSAYSEMLNAGAIVDSNWIWSPQSFVPRSGSMNLTVDLFGQSVNLMEVGGRVEGLDSILESFFGPDAAENVETPSEIRTMDQQFRRNNPEPQGSYFFRMFGHEMNFAEFKGLDMDSIMSRFNFLQFMIDLAKEHDIEMTKSMVMLDSELCVPTIAGFPLTLTVDGTVVTDLKLRGRMDLRNIGSSPRTMAIVGTIRPSAALKINGQMGVNAWMAKTGLKMVNTLHTSTLADGSIELENGGVFNVDINMPEDSMDVFSAESKFYVTYRENEREQQMLTEGRFETEECTGTFLQTALGLQMCAEVSVPKVTAPGAPWLPLTGPARASLRLNKMDTFSKYHMEARLQNERISQGVYNRLFAISFNTPESQVDRELTIRFDLNEAERSMNIDLRSPWKKLDFTSALDLTDEMKRVTGSLSIDDARTYGILAELGMSGNEVRNLFTPRIQVTIPEQDPYTFTSEILYRPGKRAQIEMALENVFSSPVTLNGELTRISKSKQLRYEGDISVRAPLGKAQLIGAVDHAWSKGEITTNVNLETKYKLTRGGQDTLGLHTQMHFTQEGEATQLSLTGGTATTLWPEYDMDYSIMASKGESTVEFSFNSGLTTNKPARITVTTHANHDFTGTTKTLAASMGFQAPFLNMDYNGKLQHSHSTNYLSTIVTVGEETKAEVRLNRNHPKNMSAELTFQLPGRHMAYSQFLEQRENNEYHHNLTISLDHYTQLSFVSMYRAGTSHDLTTTMTSPFTPTVVLEGSVVPNLRNMAASGRVAFDGQEYALLGSWNHRNGFNGNANVEFTMPQRKITWDGQLSHHENTIANSMTFKWDADMDATKKLVTEFAFDTSSSPSMTVDAQWWPNKFVTFTTSLTNDELTFWHATRDLAGSARFTSSFTGFEEISVEFKHGRTESQVSTHGEMTWSDTIAFDYAMNKHDGWNNVDNTFTLITPWAEFNTLHLENSYNKQSGSFVSNSKVQWGEEMITLATSLSGNFNNFEGEMRLMTPFASFEDITFGMHYNFENGVLDSNIQTLLGSDTYSFTVQMTHATDNNDISNRGTITVVLPLYNSPNTLVWEHSNDKRTVNTHVEFSAEGQRSTIDISAKIRRQSTLTVRLSTPYIQDVSFGFTHEAEKNSLRRTTSIEASYGAQSIQLSNTFNLVNGQFLFVETRFTTPFTELIQLTIDNKLENGQFIMNNEFRWGDNTDKIALTGTFTNDHHIRFLFDLERVHPAYQVAVQLFTPWTETVSFTSASTKNVEDSWQLTANAMQNGNSVARATFTDAVHPGRKYTVEIHSISQYMTNFLFDFEFEGHSRMMATKMRLEHNMLPSHIQFEMDMNTADLTNLKFEVDFEAPIENWDTIHLLAKQVTSDGNWRTDFTLECPMKKIVYSDVFIFASFFKWNSDTTLTIDDTSRYQLVGNMNNDDGYTMAFICRMPESHDKTFNFRHEGSMTNFRTTTQLTHEVGSTFESVMEFGMTSDTVQGALTITTPVTGWTRTHVAFEHSGTMASCSSNARVEIYGQTFTGESEFAATSDLVKGALTITTPVTEWTRTHVAFEHSGTMASCSSNARVEICGQTFTGESEFAATSDLVKGALTITTPFTEWTRTHVAIEHSGSMTSFANNALVVVYGQTFRGESEFSMTSNLVKGALTITTPVTEWTITHVAFEHSGTMASFSNNARVEIYGQTFTGESEFAATSDLVKGALTITTPFTEWTRTHVAFEHSGSMTSFANNAIVEIYDHTHTGETEFRLNGNTLSATIGMTTDDRTLRLTVSHEGDLMSFRNSFSMNHNNHVQYSAGSEFHTTTMGKSGQITLNIPSICDFRGYFEHSGSMFDWTNNAGIQIDGNTFSARNEFKFTSTEFHVLSRFNVPEEISFEISHNGNMYDFTNTLAAHYFTHAITGNSVFSFTSEKMQLSAALETPFEDYRNIRVEASRDGPYIDSNNNFDLSIENSHIIGQLVMQYSANDVAVSGELRTPFLDTIRFSTTHNGPMTDFTNAMSASLGEEAISTDVTFKFVGNLVEGTVSLRTPFTTFNTMTVHFTHTGDMSRFQNEITATLNGQTITAGTSNECSTSRKQGSLTITTPFSTLNNLAINYNHNGQMSNFNNEINLSLNGQAITATTSFNMESGIEGTFQLTTPFETLNTLRLTLNHEGTMVSFTNGLTAVFNTHTIRTETTFSNTDSRIKGMLSIMTPMTEATTFIGSFNHEFETTGFSNEIMVTLNGDEWRVNTGFNGQNGNLRISTPEHTFESTFTHSGIWSNFENQLTINVDNFVINANSMFVYTNTRLEGSMALSYPEHSFEISTANSGNMDEFSNELTVTYNGDRTTLQNSYSYRAGHVEGTFTISRNSDFTTGIAYRHTGSWDNFDNEFTLSYNGQSGSMSNIFKYSEFSYKEFELISNIRTPFTGYETMGLQFNHEGLWSNTQNALTMSLNSNTIAISHVFKWLDNLMEGSFGIISNENELFSVGFRSEGTFTSMTNGFTFTYDSDKVAVNHVYRWTDNVMEKMLSISYQDEEIFSTGFRHEGTITNFNNEIMVTVKGHTGTLTNLFRMVNGELEINSELATPFSVCDRMLFSIVHRGPISNFNNQMTFTWNEWVFSSTSQLAVNGPEITASYGFTTPFERLSAFNIAGSHTGDWYNCNSQMTVSLNGKSLEANSRFRLEDEIIEGSFTMNQLHMAFHHNSANDAVDNDFTFSFNGEQGSASSSLRRSRRGITGSAQINTPFEGYKTMAVSARSDDSNYVFQIRRDDEEFSLSTSASSDANTHEASFTLTTPFSSAHQITGRFSHDGPLTNFHQSGSLEIDGYNLGYSVEFTKTSNSMTGKLGLDSPFFDHFEIGTTLAGTMTNFNKNCYVLIQGQRYSSTMELRLTENTHFMISFMTPEEYSITFNQAGPWSAFTSEMIIKMAGESYTNGISFRKEGSTVECTITTQMPGQMQIRFNSEGDSTNFRQSSEITHAGVTRSQNTEFSTDGRHISGRLSLNNLCSSVQTFSMEFNNQGRWSNFQNMGRIELNGVTYEANTYYKYTESKMMAGINFKLPQEYGISFVQKGDVSDMTLVIKTTIADEQTTMELAFKNNINGPVEASGHMRTPYRGYRNFAFEYTLNTNGIFATSGLLRTPFELLDNIAFEFRHDGSPSRFTSTGRITTPWLWLNEGTFEINHQGSLTNFQTGGHFVVNGNRFGAVASFEKSSETTTASLSLASPFFESVSGSVSLAGSLNNFNTHVNLEMNGERIENTMTLTTSPAITFTTSLLTPFTSVQEFSATFNLEGSLENFNTETTFVLNGDRFVNTMSVATNPSITFSTTLRTPFTEVQEFTVTFNHQGSMNNFNTHVNLGLNGQLIENTIAFSTSPAMTFITTLRTPFTEVQEFTVTFNHQGSLNDFTTSAEATFNGQTVRSNVSFRKTGSTMETTSETVIPGYPTMGHALTFTGNMENFRLTMNVKLPCEEYPTFGVTYNHEGTAARFECSFEITTPFSGYERITGTINHNGAMSDFTNNVSIQNGAQLATFEATFRFASTDMTASMALTSTHASLRNFRASFEHHFTSNAINGQTIIAHNDETLYEMDYNVDLSASKRMTVTFRQPVTMTISIANTWDSISNNVMGFSLDYDNSPYNVEIAVRNSVFTFVCTTPTRNYQLTASFDLTETTITNDVTFQWSSNPEDRLTMTLEMTRNTRGQQSMYDGSLSLNAKAYTFRTTFSHVITPGRHYVTEMNIQGLVLRSDLVLRQPNAREFTLTITAQHPSFTQDVVCTIEARIEPEMPRFDGRFTMVFADQTFELQGRIADESQSGGEKRYVAEAHVSHPASALDVQFTSQLTNNDETMGGNMEVSYMMTEDRQRKNAALLAEINKLREEIKIQVQEHENLLMSVSGRRTVSNTVTGHHHFSVTGQMAEHEMLAEIDMDKSSPSFDFSFTLEPEQEFRMHGRYVDPSSIMIEAYREIQGARVQDSQMSLRLSESNVLNARAFFRPHIIDDIMSLFSINFNHGEITSTWVITMIEEFNQKMTLLQASTEPLRSSWSDLESYMSTTYQRMYNDNDFYIREISDVVTEYCRITSERMEVIRQQYAEHFERKMAEINMYLEEFNVMVMEAMEMLAVSIAQYQAELTHHYNTHAQKLQNAALEWIDSVRSHPKVQSLITRVTTMEPAEYFIPLRETYDYHMQRALNTWEEHMTGNQALNTVKSWIETALQNVHSIYEYMELDETVQGWVEEARQMDSEIVIRRVLGWIKQQLDSVSFDVVSYEPSQGEYEVRITMPFNLQDLRTLPNIEIPDYFNQMSEMYEEHMPTFNMPDYSLWDTYYNYKPASSDPAMWIPPFNAHATIAGNQHFMTFDKKFYEFAGDDCSFLLARDFIDGKFSVVLNYEDGQRRSLNVHSDNKNIEIASNLRVTVDGAATELPYVTGQTTVRRLGDSIRVDNNHGITVTCELPHNICNVNVSGWYYGKTGGLLGTYDNEPSNDFMTVERVPASSVEEFAASWSVGRTCGSSNTATLAPALDDTHYQMCARYFEDSSSPLRPCFQQVDTAAFMSMCLNDVTFGDAETAACDMAAFFVNECTRNGVNVRVPTECVKCELAGETLPEGGNMTFLGEAIPQEADVVFVISHQECNEDSVTRVSAIAEQIERNFQASGVSSVHFGLVGFGGSGLLAQPHSMTLSSELMGNKEALATVLQSFTTQAGTEEDAFNAINMAAQYPFRPLATKTVIVIPCDSCHENTVDYGVLASVLDARDITLHTLMQHDFRLQTPTPKTSFIFGVDRVGLFTPKHVGDEQLVGDAEMRGAVELPKDKCAAMSDRTDGVTFDINKLVHSRPGMQKRFLDVLSRMVVKKTSDCTTSDCTCVNCECVGENGGVPLCRRCNNQSDTLTWISGILPVLNF